LAHANHGARKIDTHHMWLQLYYTDMQKAKMKRTIAEFSDTDSSAWAGRARIYKICKETEDCQGKQGAAVYRRLAI